MLLRPGLLARARTCMKVSKRPAASRKAQNIVEYAICLSAVLLAVLGMVTYVKRGLSGRYKNVVDAATVSAEADQYEPYYYSSEFNVQSSKNTAQTIRVRGERINTFTDNTTIDGSADYTLFNGEE